MGVPGDPNSLMVRFNQSTQQTFQMLESIVAAFGGFAQMLESTYMATHSSFFGEDPRITCLGRQSIYGGNANGKIARQP